MYVHTYVNEKKYIYIHTHAHTHTHTHTHKVKFNLSRAMKDQGQIALLFL